MIGDFKMTGIKRMNYFSFIFVILIFFYIFVFSQIFGAKKYAEKKLKKQIVESVSIQNHVPPLREILLQTVFAMINLESEDVIALKAWPTNWFFGRVQFEALVSAPKIGFHCVAFTLSQTSLDEWRLDNSVIEINSTSQRCMNKFDLVTSEINSGLPQFRDDQSRYSVEKETMLPSGELSIEGYLMTSQLNRYVVKLKQKNYVWEPSSFKVSPIVFR